MSNTDVGDAWGEPRPTTAGGSSPKEMVADAAQTVKQEAASFANEAREKAADKLEQHKQTASQTLGDFANAIRKAGDELEGADQSMATRVVRQAADGLENLARSVSDKRPEELLDAVRDFGRRNPTAFIAGSVLVGVALGRFLKSSSTADSSGGGAISTPATFSSSMGAAPDVGAATPGSFSATGGAPMSTAAASGGLMDPTASGATSIGMTDAELGAQGAMADDLDVQAEVGGADEDLEREDIGDSGATDADRSRFGSGS